MVTERSDGQHLRRADFGHAGCVLNRRKPGVPNAFGLIGREANAIAPGKRPLHLRAGPLAVRCRQRARPTPHRRLRPEQTRPPKCRSLTTNERPTRTLAVHHMTTKVKPALSRTLLRRLRSAAERARLPRPRLGLYQRCPGRQRGDGDGSVEQASEPEPASHAAASSLDVLVALMTRTVANPRRGRPVQHPKSMESVQSGQRLISCRPRTVSDS
jgi:hypothetical protein